jgi:hypothetical protein
MKLFIYLLFLSFSLQLLAQKPCEYTTNVNDSLGSYKTTKEYLVHERNFGDRESYVFLSLINTDGTPLLNFQVIQKNTDFIKANCINADTKLYFQLSNGKIVQMIHNNEENCGSSIQVPDSKKYTRLNSGLFLFIKGTLEDLKTSPINLLRVQYASETVDYVMAKEFYSELSKATHYPENYFIDNLKCVE